MSEMKKSRERRSDSSPTKSNKRRNLKWGSQQEERDVLNKKLRLGSADSPMEAIALSTEIDYQLFHEALGQEDTSIMDTTTTTSGVVVPQLLRMGAYEMETLYPSPYPAELTRSSNLFVCEFCLKCVASATTLRRHMTKCQWKHPPGNEIYRDDNLSFWEIDGKNAKWYCQNLCLLAKLFLDHKTLYFEVEPFRFYVLTENNSTGCRMLGYFSKEKESAMNCNLSCLLTLPTTQRRGYGRLLIDLSYVLSRLEGRIGSPEHPLSDLGLISYRSYWRSVIFDHLKNIICKDTVSSTHLSIKDVSHETGIHPNDIISTLQLHRMIRYHKGRYIVLTVTFSYRPRNFPLKNNLNKAINGNRRQRFAVKMAKLKWKPSDEEGQ